MGKTIESSLVAVMIADEESSSAEESSLVAVVVVQQQRIMVIILLQEDGDGDCVSLCGSYQSVLLFSSLVLTLKAKTEEGAWRQKELICYIVRFYKTLMTV